MAPLNLPQCARSMIGIWLVDSSVFTLSSPALVFNILPDEFSLNATEQTFHFPNLLKIQLLRHHRGLARSSSTITSCSLDFTACATEISSSGTIRTFYVSGSVHFSVLLSVCLFSTFWIYYYVALYRPFVLVYRFIIACISFKRARLP